MITLQRPGFQILEDWIVLEIPLCLCYAGFVQKEGTSFYLGMANCWSCFVQAGVVGLSFLACFLFAQLTPIANKSSTPSQFSWLTGWIYDL
ncbi:hypothetical protein K7X08_034170 [Anisodus acutangulus]|uniref:Uncharacterized protein n=1 Tax=Anisodus acutangulus TaxID=402998 RepID=A0A9Q1R0N7_9SOLA|nr:hypothetical protein K7X08_034170 [Anisodus acutangulus]